MQGVFHGVRPSQEQQVELLEKRIETPMMFFIGVRPSQWW
jgi:hypothetical protein